MRMRIRMRMIVTSASLSASLALVSSTAFSSSCIVTSGRVSQWHVTGSHNGMSQAVTDSMSQHATFVPWHAPLQRALPPPNAPRLPLSAAETTEQHGTKNP